MRLRLGSLDLEAVIERNHWGWSASGVLTWLAEHVTMDYVTWGDDWRFEDIGVAALIGPVTLRTELRQDSATIRVVDVLGAICEVAGEIPSLLVDKDPLGDPVTDGMVGLPKDAFLSGEVGHIVTNPCWYHTAVEGEDDG